MKRSLFTSLFLSLALAGCGATTPDAANEVGGDTAMEGPDSDGNFYVVGFAGAALPGETVTLTNNAGTSVSVIAENDGSFAAMLWSAIDKSVEVETSGSVAMAASSEPQRINVNYASRTGLEAVPGIGETLAQRIIEHRNEKGLFSEVSDLEDISGIGPASLEELRPYVETKIDLNTATKNQLLVLPSIGAAKASALVAWRSANGPFVNVSDVLLVPGLRPADYDAIVDYVKAGVVPSHPGASLVDVNHAGADALITLPGIGEGKARAIVDYREKHGAFHSKEDLIYVPGIGPTTLAGIRDLITVGVLDVKIGTIVAEGAWQYESEGDVSGSSFPSALLVKFDRSLDEGEMLVTFVGGGYCAGAEDCAPFTLKGSVVSESDEGVRYRLSGLMPAEGGSFAVAGTVEDEGLIDHDGATISFTAVRGEESYRLALSGYRVLE